MAAGQILHGLVDAGAGLVGADVIEIRVASDIVDQAGVVDVALLAANEDRLAVGDARNGLDRGLRNRGNGVVVVIDAVKIATNSRR